LYPPKLSFIIKEKIKTFNDKNKLKEFMTTKPIQQKTLKGILHKKEEDKCICENTGKNNSREESR
jgi:hypothetical protein